MPRPPLVYRLSGRQWRAVDAVAAVVVATLIVFDIRLRHGFRFQSPSAPMAVLYLAVSLPGALRRTWPVPVLTVVTASLAVLTALGRAQLYADAMLAMAIYMVAVRCKRPAALAALIGTELAIVGGVLAAAASSRGQADTAHSASVSDADPGSWA